MSRNRRPGLLFCGLLALVLSAQWAIAQETTPTGPQRWEPEIKKFEAADEKSPPKPGQVVFVGSSSARLWKLETSFPGLDALNRGFGGSELSDSVHFFDRIVKPYRPRLVVLYAGDNDIGKKRTPEEVAGQFRKFLAKMQQSLPQTRLLYIGIKPSIKRWNLIEQVRLANDLIKKECEKSPLATFIDIDAPMLGTDGLPRPELFVQDGLHMSPEGYQVWADLIRPYVTRDARLGPVRTLYDAYHPWTPPATLAEWETESAKLRTQVQVACGLYPWPEKTDLNPVIHGRVDRGDYTIDRVCFSSAPGQYVTGSLYRPKVSTGRMPGVLCPHGHWQEGRFHDAGVVEAEKQLASGAESFLSGARHPLQARMVQLARMGCVVFHYDMIGVADNKPLSHRAGFADADASLWLHNKLGLQTWNSIRALDFITSLDDVDPTRIGVTGASGGGTQTFLLCALDSRATVAFPAVMVSTAMQGGCICENSDLLRIGINNIAIAALCAPRPMAMTGADDWTIRIETRGLPELKQVYGFYGKWDDVAAHCFPQFSHNYNEVSREMMFDWFNQHLHLAKAAPVQQSDFWPLSREEMTVFDETHPAPADALDESALREQMRTRDRAAFEALVAKPAKEYQAVMKPAVAVLLPTATGEIATVLGTPRPLTGGTIAQDFTVTCEQTNVPCLLLKPTKASGKLALWLDSAGKSHLLAADGNPEPAVQSLLDAGWTVASADLLLTGSTANETNPYLTEMKSVSPSHVASVEGVDYTGFVYGYNRPLLAERVIDIDRVHQALSKMDFNRIELIGTGEAGVWALLARSRWPQTAVARTLVDLNGFAFDEIDTALHPNLVPGALKYGGLGGLAAIAAPASLSLFSAEATPELAPLQKQYAGNATLQLNSKPLTRDDVVTAMKVTP
ncbi:GDSL-type esterase/lipase family protein [Planctomicrobium piriforme]|uniref:Lysophospholipase L1 n=1 Tax=Planctomicrobium piriforme TaxID=1576369 RepID=A0A1I3P4D3_9PLAN|nr:GDSL-type esterase/lipase family protein [Planctomicrobium piriforme]SFJ16187.1 Lysophospholipase L1 [Planctomicrobium piriforme]